MDANIVIAVIGGLCAAVPGVIALLWQIRKDKRGLPQAEISAGIEASKEAAAVIAGYSAELKQVRDQLRQVREEQKDIVEELERLNQSNIEKDALIQEWRAGIERLIAQIISLDHVPVWRPKPMKAEIK